MDVDVTLVAGVVVVPNLHRVVARVPSKFSPDTVTAVPPDMGPRDGLTELKVGEAT
jgi:hypothetical protein